MDNSSVQKEEKRILKLKREKTFVGCLMPLNAYIEDTLNGDTIINGVNCRKLGSLKNGEEKSFEISSSQCKVFVIADKLSKNYCNDFYQLPYGASEISLTGKCKLNPASGNAFRFNNNDNEEALANRKRGSKRGLIILLSAVIVGFVIGFIIGIAGIFFPQTFECDGLEISLPDDFVEVEVDGYNACYANDEVVICVLKEKLEDFVGYAPQSTEEYGYLVLQSNGKSLSLLKEESGLTCFEYDATVTNDNNYFCVLYEGSDAFWLVQFIVPLEKADSYRDDVIEWASSVELD